MTFSAFLDSLTLVQAQRWKASKEKYMYVQDLLSAYIFRASKDRVLAVEERFEALLLTERWLSSMSKGGNYE